MWADNETTTDLLGFKVHCDLVRDVVTDFEMLPVVMGVFGDWGSGKSSVMKMLEQELKDVEGVACLYFNGWTFEGYEDAKTALLSSILVALGENERFGPKIKNRVVGLLQRVKWMEVAKQGVKHVAVPLAVAAMTGGVSAIPMAVSALAAGLLPTKKADETKKAGDDDDKGINWSQLVNEEEHKPDLLEVRKFREDFGKMLADTDLKSLVIVIDDLDRCLPERIIDTLEAIKLFVAVPNTAFVIGADERIVRHAISTRYAKRQLDEDQSSVRDEYDLTTDYLEKLVQIPYHLPRLSPDEVETYINLLLAEKFLSEPSQRDQLRSAWIERRSKDMFTPLTGGVIAEFLGGQVPEELRAQLLWSNAVARPLTEGLKGNPRQVKRMLNAMLLRRRLAKVADLEIRDEVLAKLMVLEYSHNERFLDLNGWQAASDGKPSQLRKLEEAALDDKTPVGDEFSKWDASRVRNWLRMEPPLKDVDLRDYFWVARDRMVSTSAAGMMPPFIKRLLQQLIGENDGERVAAVKVAVAEKDAGYQEMLMALLEDQLRRQPDQDVTSKSLVEMIEGGLEGAGASLFKGLHAAAPDKIPAPVAPRIIRLARTKPELKEQCFALLEHWAKFPATVIGKAATLQLKAKGN